MQHQLEELSEERDHIRNQIRRAPEEEKAQLKLDAKEITTKMSPLRKELKIANRIAERSPKVWNFLNWNGRWSWRPWSTKESKNGVMNDERNKSRVSANQQITPL